MHVMFKWTYCTFEHDVIIATCQVGLLNNETITADGLYFSKTGNIQDLLPVITLLLSLGNHISLSMAWLHCLHLYVDSTPPHSPLKVCNKIKYGSLVFIYQGFQLNS